MRMKFAASPKIDWMAGEAKAKVATPSPRFMASSWRAMTSRIAVSAADCATTAELPAHTKRTTRMWAYRRIGRGIVRLLGQDTASLVRRARRAVPRRHRLRLPAGKIGSNWQRRKHRLGWPFGAHLIAWPTSGDVTIAPSHRFA